ncbi:hypothetical protein AMTRI_Chr11g96720 [Amborella trichopoda]|uniref:C2H2-type domain-containing protein n=1 Tax=Amborella trichopoda TaxID=13333 RepID=W1NFC2_AMBTC|nr:uncharacterized protein LOC18421765 [Amborella trichopoda]ERM93870.1 hypothetical protein AMTR_s00139p00027000 [Amborella trichopoda]|eukprot:XP_006826633.1 uncharacterized protein LOC18421765 [Amborella trichopoda]
MASSSRNHPSSSNGVPSSQWHHVNVIPRTLVFSPTLSIPPHPSTTVATVTTTAPAPASPQVPNPVAPRRSGCGAKRYLCTMCGKRYVSSQALGAHQNSHRIEQIILKRAQRNYRIALENDVKEAFLDAKIVNPLPPHSANEQLSPSSSSSSSQMPAPLPPHPQRTLSLLPPPQRHVPHFSGYGQAIPSHFGPHAFLVSGAGEINSLRGQQPISEHQPVHEGLSSKVPNLELSLGLSTDTGNNELDLTLHL